mgnify:FL=1|jgi:hypothetical protein
MSKRNKQSRNFTLSFEKSPVRKRSPEKVSMDRLNRPKVFRSLKRELEAQDADDEIKEYLNECD